MKQQSCAATEHQYNTEGQTALELTGIDAGVMETFVYNLAVLKSVITQPLKARGVDL
jgi:hypothetical protein